jgi:hypothetical protein
VRATNLVLRFALELATLGILAHWGATRGGATWQRAALALGAPAAVALFWGLVIAPRAPARLPELGKAVLALAVFALAVAALASRGHRELAAGFAAVAVVNAVLLHTTARRVGRYGGCGRGA